MHVHVYTYEFVSAILTYIDIYAYMLALGGQFCNSGGPCPKGGLAMGKPRGALSK